MTVLVGVRCKDGIVVGADSIATSSSGPVPIMQIASNEKISVFDNSLISASTGSVGLSQRLHVHVEAAMKGGVFKTLPKHEAFGNISKRFLGDLQSTGYQSNLHTGIGFGSLLATSIKDELFLVEYDPVKYQPEIKDGKLCYVSMGSGQALADPFLAFVSRVLWNNEMPDVRLGKFGLYWTLAHTIKLAPGMVGDPIKMATITKQSGKWNAAVVDYQEATEYIIALENSISAGLDVSSASADPLPQPPAGG